MSYTSQHDTLLFFTVPAPTKYHTLSLHDALPIFATTARDAPAAKPVARQWNGRGATVQDLRPAPQLCDNARVPHVPNIWHRLFPDRDQAPAPRCAISAPAFQSPAE